MSCGCILGNLKQAKVNVRKIPEERTVVTGEKNSLGLWKVFLVSTENNKLVFEVVELKLIWFSNYICREKEDSSIASGSSPSEVGKGNNSTNK